MRELVVREGKMMLLDLEARRLWRYGDDSLMTFFFSSFLFAEEIELGL
jgi:hypothetical protein